ncbi:MAG: VOC family protein [Sandaracinaceae bacterium]|nr:VOC family protein [Sandaracinaceae bacterium]
MRTMPATHPSLAPYLFYEDVASAAQFLQDAFGFRLGFTSPDPEGGLAHAQLLHDGGMIMLGHAGEGGLGLARSARSLGKLHAGVYVFVEDVDAHCDRARAAGAKVMLPPADQPWGDRMYCAVDHEGQFWMFARRLVSR